MNTTIVDEVYVAILRAADHKRKGNPRMALVELDYAFHKAKDPMVKSALVDAYRALKAGK